MTDPILITGADRSGSGLIAKILSICGAFSGETTALYENKAVSSFMDFHSRLNSTYPFMPDFTGKDFDNFNWRELVLDVLRKEGLKENSVFFVKSSLISQTWPLWNEAFPNAKWIIIRRKPGGIIRSCIQTAYMTRFKKKENQRVVGAKTEEEGWLWWIHEYEKKFVEISNSVSDCTVVWPERMLNDDYLQIKEVVESCGLKWNENIPNIIRPLLKEGGQNGKSN